MKRIKMVGDKYIQAKLKHEYYLYCRKNNDLKDESYLNELMRRLKSTEKELRKTKELLEDRVNDKN